MSEVPSGPKQGKRNRKWGRNKKFCTRYSQENRREKNKIAKLLSYCTHHPNDEQAHNALKNWVKEWPFFGRQARHYLEQRK